MKIKNIIKLLVLLLPLVIAVSSCDDKKDDSPANLYQEYQVLVENGTASAFANFREGGAAGQRVNVGNEHITVNKLPMYYQKPVTDTDPEFTYFATLMPNHKKAIFRYRNSKGKTLVNTSEYGEMPVITLIGNPYEVKVGDVLKLELNGAMPNEVKAYLTGVSAISAKPIELSVISSIDFSTAQISLPQLSGLYDLILDYVQEDPVTAGDGTASGTLTTVIRTRKTLKF